jgi:hypothetical protein
MQHSLLEYIRVRMAKNRSTLWTGSPHRPRLRRKSHPLGPLRPQMAFRAKRWECIVLAADGHVSQSLRRGGRHFSTERFSSSPRVPAGYLRRGEEKKRRTGPVARQSLHTPSPRRPLSSTESSASRTRLAVVSPYHPSRAAKRRVVGCCPREDKRLRRCGHRARRVVGCCPREEPAFRRRPRWSRPMMRGARHHDRLPAATIAASVHGLP